MTYKGIGECRAITLTTAAGENVVGTAGNDTFSAVLTNNATGVDAANSTLNLGDIVDGAAGTDTLNLILSGPLAAAAQVMPAGVTIRNVEVVNLVHTDAVAAGTVTGSALANSATYAGIQQLWQVDNDAVAPGTFGNVVVGTGVTAGFRSTNDFNTDVAANVTVTAATTSQATIAAALDGVATASGITFANSGGATSLRTLEVSGKVAAAAVGDNGNLSITGTATAETLKLAMTSAVDLTLTTVASFGAGLKTIDASASTGAIRADGGSGSAAITTTANLETVKLGSGGDRVTLTVSAATKALSVDAGAGADTITVNGVIAAANTDASVAVTLGAGKDTFNAAGVVSALGVSGLQNLGTIAAAAADQTLVQLTEQLITVTDFNTSEDVLSLGGTGVALNTTQLTSLAGAGDLLAAVKGAAAITNGAGALTTLTKSVVFNFGGDAYVFVDNTTGADIAATDALVKLVGVDAELLSNVQNGNFVL